ncbi:MAG: VWA domain-containing protein [Gammaproteobacteria bacterium]|jgi:hypothetical protein|nr:VWA domain-containing protein [Gammaproteobacteria bacterium]
MTHDPRRLPTAGAAAEVRAFLDRLAETPVRAGTGNRGRLLFALDATASREPTWDVACRIQGEMFEATHDLGGLDVQLCYYRGFREFEASPWVSDPATLLARMTGVSCRAGETQLVRVLRHTRSESAHRRVNALVFVGDCMEEEPDALREAAGQLALIGVPAFLFHEGNDPIASQAFHDVARITHGACCQFDAGSARQLRDLLRAVAVYASGGRDALARLGDRQGGIVLRLSHQLGRG